MTEHITKALIEVLKEKDILNDFDMDRIKAMAAHFEKGMTNPMTFEQVGYGNYFCDAEGVQYKKTGYCTAEYCGRERSFSPSEWVDG